jgi:hypothetical protein
VNLRAYFDRTPDEKMRRCSAWWSDERVIEWTATSGMTARRF